MDPGSNQVIDVRWGGGLAYFGVPVDEVTRRRLTGEDRYLDASIPEGGFLMGIARERALTKDSR